jgi:BTB/POZ domain
MTEKMTSVAFFDNHPPIFSFLKDEKLTDITLTAEGKMIKAHKLILAASSKYFEVRITALKFNTELMSTFYIPQELFEILEDKHPVIVLKSVSIKFLLLIIEYIYLGKVDLQAEDVAGFKEVAKELQIKVEFEEPSLEDMSQDLLTEVSTTEQDENMSSSYSDETMEENLMMELSVASTVKSGTGRKLENNDEHKTGPPPKKLKRVVSGISPTSTVLTSKKAPDTTSSSGKPKKNSQCSYCDRTMRERDRNYHQKFCWKNANRIASDCSYCPKAFSVPGKLRLHMNSTHPEIEF